MSGGTWIGETFVLLCIYLTNTGSLAGLAVLNGTHIIIVTIVISLFCDKLLLLFTCLACHEPPSPPHFLFPYLQSRAQDLTPEN